MFTRLPGVKFFCIKAESPVTNRTFLTKTKTNNDEKTLLMQM
jgi:hypothetical protein